MNVALPLLRILALALATIAAPALQASRHTRQGRFS